jgi:hypothetical protein
MHTDAGGSMQEYHFGIPGVQASRTRRANSPTLWISVDEQRWKPLVMDTQLESLFFFAKSRQMRTNCAE